MGKDKRNKIIAALKIASPLMFAAFILIANISYSSKYEEGTYKILNDDEYAASFVSDVADAKKSVECALFMFKTSGYDMNNLEEPVPLIIGALTDAAARGVEVTIIFEKSDKKDDLSNEYNKKTADYLQKRGVNTLFDKEDKKLHAKLCLIDDRIIYTGSHNFTYSAMKRNSESSARIVSAQDAEEIKKYFKQIR